MPLFGLFGFEQAYLPSLSFFWYETLVHACSALQELQNDPLLN